MKVVTLMVGLVLLGSSSAIAQTEDAEPLHMHDAAWIRDAGERLARCAGTYRGAAAVMRGAGQATRAAEYAESVASGALFASYLLLTSPEAAAALQGADPTAYIEALAWGTKRNFIEMAAAESPAQAKLLRDCTRTSALQSAVLRGTSSAAPAAAAAQPKS